MCDFVSWIELNPVGEQKQVYFLTDKDVYSTHGRKTLKDSIDNDFIGHGAIRAFYGPDFKGGTDKEYRDFWDKSKYPPEIVKHLDSPESLIDTWGKTLRQSLQIYDIIYILNNAPPLWRKALFDICFAKIAANAVYSYLTLCDVKELTEDQRNTLFTKVATDAYSSYFTLLHIKGLTKDQRNTLVAKVATNTSYSYDTLLHVKGLTKDQRTKLEKASRA